MTDESPTVPMVSSAGTPRRTVRVADETWVPAAEKAARQGETLSDVIRAALEAYIADEFRWLPPDAPHGPRQCAAE